FDGPRGIRRVRAGDDRAFVDVANATGYLANGRRQHRDRAVERDAASRDLARRALVTGGTVVQHELCVLLPRGRSDREPRRDTYARQIARVDLVPREVAERGGRVGHADEVAARR